ncbi:hypothetical protein JMUB7518_27890 [Staphylococcus aureus]
MQRSLVGSEMCIRDRVITLENGSDSGRTNSILSANNKLTGNNAIITNTKSLPNIINIHLNKDLVVKGTTVSYTHLTLPTN